MNENNNDGLKVNEPEPANRSKCSANAQRSRIHGDCTVRQSSNKAQYSIVYLLLISGILIFFMGAVFLMVNSFQRTTAEEYGGYVIENIMAKIESSLMDLKYLSASAENATLYVKIPELVGEQNYLISAGGGTVSIRTYGNPSLFESRNMTFWNATLRGSVFSSKGAASLQYTKTGNLVTFK